MSRKSKFFTTVVPSCVHACTSLGLFHIALAGIFAVSLSLASSTAKADLFFDLAENLNTGQVEVSLSGSLDLNALGANPSSGSNSLLFVEPMAGLVSVGTAAGFELYDVNTAFTSFGTGPQNLFGSGGTGDRVGLFTGQQIGLPTGYLSNDLLMGTSSFNGSFSSLGLTPGSYVTSLDSGVATDSVFVNVGPVVVVPEPSALILLAVMTSGLMTARRRKPLV